MLAINTQYRQTFSALGLNSVDSVVAHFAGSQCVKTTTVVVKPALLSAPGRPSVPVFYKQYEHSPPAWGFVGRSSKARCELESYDAFSQLGIPCAEWVFCGESRDCLGRLRRAVIVTRTIPDALSLIDFVKLQCPDAATEPSRSLRVSLRRQLAGLTARIHTAGFYHHDLVWRNILVTWTPPAEPRLWWIDCPRGSFRRWTPWRRRHQLKDLASLDKSAAKFCDRAERISFIREYLGLKRLDEAAKRLIRETLDYRQGRWPEDWNER